MKKEITLGNLLSIFIPVLMIILAWGNSVEVKLREYDVRLELVERTNEKIENKIDKIQITTTNILIELQNKKDRD